MYNYNSVNFFRNYEHKTKTNQIQTLFNLYTNIFILATIWAWVLVKWTGKWLYLISLCWISTQSLQWSKHLEIVPECFSLVFWPKIIFLGEKSSNISYLINNWLVMFFLICNQITGVGDANLIHFSKPVSSYSVSAIASLVFSMAQKALPKGCS